MEASFRYPQSLAHLAAQELGEGTGKPETPIRDTLRFLVCGAVDDGKSTLVGRLLHDCGQIAIDQLEQVRKDSQRFGTTGGEIDYALLTDGLEDERAQGITIDVAYRYFASERRAFVVVDAPGHEQYTRNMATGASNADHALLVVDAQKGIRPQTRLHAYLCSLMGIRSVTLAVNKMDQLDFDQSKFDRIADEFSALAARFGLESAAIPVAARTGDNLVHAAASMPWYAGPTVLRRLEAVNPEVSKLGLPFRFPVQWVARPSDAFRGYAGTIAGGTLRVGDTVLAKRSGTTALVSRILAPSGEVGSAHAGDAVMLELDKDIDIGRGDMLCAPDPLPLRTDQFCAKIVWMSDAPLIPGRSYWLKAGPQRVRATVTSIRYLVDTDALQRLSARQVQLNEIAACHLELAAPIFVDPYVENRETGNFILIDRTTNATVGAGLVLYALRRAGNLTAPPLCIDADARCSITRQRPVVLWFTGLSGAGKSAIADKVERELHGMGQLTYLLDGDVVRQGISRDLGFTDADRAENMRRIGEIARLFLDAGVIVLCALISPFRAERDALRERIGAERFLEIFVDAPLDVCIARDPKGLYARALSGRLPNFTGIDSPYEPPVAPDLHLASAQRSIDDLAGDVIEALRRQGVLAR